MLSIQHCQCLFCISALAAFQLFHPAMFLPFAAVFRSPSRPVPPLSLAVDYTSETGLFWPHLDGRQFWAQQDDFEPLKKQFSRVVRKKKVDST